MSAQLLPSGQADGHRNNLKHSKLNNAVRLSAETLENIFQKILIKLLEMTIFVLPLPNKR